MNNDLYIALKYMTPAELKRTSREFSADGEDRSTPGWFVEAYRNEGYDRVVKLTRVTDADALHIAHSLDGVLGHGGRLLSATSRVNAEHKRALHRMREQAEQTMIDAARVIQQADETLGDR